MASTRALAERGLAAARTDDRGPDRRLRDAAASTRNIAPARRPSRPGRTPRPWPPPAGTAARSARLPAPTRRAARQSTPRAPARARHRPPIVPRSPEAASPRLDAIQPHQLAMLPLDVGHPAARERLERPAEPPPRLGRVLGDAALLAAILGQKHDDPIGLAVAVGAEHERVDRVGPHQERRRRRASAAGAQFAHDITRFMRHCVGRVSWVFAVLLAGCGRHEVPPQSVPPDLIVYGGARDVRTAERPGQIEVSYIVEQSFPATGLIGTIDATLRDAGWQALQTDPLNPGSPSSQVVGWWSIVDGRQTPKRTVHMWGASWRSASGDLATYFFRYESPVTADGFAVAAPSTSTVKVIGVHNPAKAASAMIEGSQRMLAAAGQAASSGIAGEDADVLKGIAEGFPLRPSLVNRSRPICRGAIEDGCVTSQTIEWVKPLPGLIAAFGDRNRTSEDLPTVAGRAVSRVRSVGAPVERAELGRRQRVGRRQPLVQPARLLARRSRGRVRDARRSRRPWSRRLSTCSSARAPGASSRPRKFRKAEPAEPAEPVEPVWISSLPPKPQLVEHPLVVAPVVAHFDVQIEVDLAVEHLARDRGGPRCRCVLIISPPLPTTMGFCESWSTRIDAKMRVSAFPPDGSSNWSMTTAVVYGSSSRVCGSTFSRMSSAASVRSVWSVR